MRKCAQECKLKKQCCKEKECRYWIEYEEDLNCSLIAIHKNGKMTLREVADRLHVSFVRIKQIEDKAIKKLTKAKSIDL
jgi:DNA-directed RNA polymerase sigma subunit (sigma70/sigma32)